MSTDNLTNADRLRLQILLLENYTWHSCVNCADWMGKTCQRFKADPPATVIVTGCEFWLPEIPF